MDITTVKNILGITSNRHDAYLAEVVPLFLEIAQDRTNNTFLEGEEPAGVKIFVAKACEFNMHQAGLQSRTMGEVSYSYETDLPKSVTKHLNPYKRVRFV